MPQYEFICHECHEGFSKVMFHGDHEEGTLVCPYCGSDRVELRISDFCRETKKSA